MSLDEALKDPHLTDEQKRKLKLAEEAHEFAQTVLGLRQTKSYTTFVQLDGPYVTYVVSAAPKDELIAYKWWFPVVGSLPYKGYFEPKGAHEEADLMKEKGYDTYVRGVSAYSTLGWFSDPILSSMLEYKDYDLVNTIIHETVHATIYIKSQADFNERLAVFFGNLGTEEFYRRREGADSKTLKQIASDNLDERIFSENIFKEMHDLEDWYAQQRGPDKEHPNAIPEDLRLARLKEIQTRFATLVRPQFKSADSYRGFETREINNARLLTYRLYFEKLDDFQAVYKKLGSDFGKMLAYCKSLEKVDDAKTELAKAASLP